MKKLFLAIALTMAAWGSYASTNDDFAWGNASVYFVITDRFCNGDTSNDVNYGRKNDYGSERMNAATFHGGDFKGMLKKAQDGIFHPDGNRCGVDDRRV